MSFWGGLWSPAEILATASLVAALAGGLAAGRRPRAGSALRGAGLALALLLALAAALFRDLVAAAMPATVPDELLAGALGRKHAEASRMVWWVGLLASIVASTTPSARLSPGQARAGVLGLLAAAVAALVVREEPLVTALVALGGWASAARWGFAPIGAAMLGIAAFAGADARLYHDAALYEVADVRRFGPDLAAWWLSAVAAVAWLGAGLAPMRWPGRAVVLGTLVVLLGARQLALSRGPHPDLVALTPGVPEWTPRVATRVPHGCLVQRQGAELEVLALERSWAPVTCPERGAFVRDRRAPVPTLAVGRDEPTSSLVGWYPGPGEVRVLVELAGTGMDRWRRIAVPFEVWPGPQDGVFRQIAGRPSANALLLEDGVLRGSAASGFPRVPLGADVGASIAAAAGERPRVDLLLPPEEVPTIGALLDLCTTAVNVRPTGLRCVIAAGDWRSF